MIKNLNNLWNNSIGTWCLIFILINIMFRATGGANPASRYATMRAMVEKGSFQIDAYKNWTVDWAQRREGETYSNKAPGPMLIGFPLFYLIEKLTKNGKKEKLNTEGDRVNYVSSGPRVAMSLILQLIPFAMICFFLIREIRLKEGGLGQLNFLALSLFFGTTISLLLNVYFGHGMTAIFLLVLFYGIYKERPFLVGLGFGFSLLCEYTMALLFPLLILTMFMSYKKNLKWVPLFLLGGLLPGILWAWYHLSTTGSFFQIPAQFQNPGFETAKHIEGNYAGMFLPWPSLENLYQLLFGPIRGLLFTQPWILLALPAPFFVLGKVKSLNKGMELFIFTYGSFLILLLMNSMFDEWHSGWMVGPRYMSAIFPCLAIFSGMIYPYFHKSYKIILWTGLAVSVLFRCLVYASTILAPDLNLWPYLFSRVEGEMWIRVIVFFLLIGLGFWKTQKNQVRLEKMERGELSCL